MLMTITQRISILNVLPLEGNIITLKVVRELQQELSFSDEELTKWKITTTKNPIGSIQISWDEEFATATKEVKIGEAAKKIISDRLKLLNEREQLPIELIDLYDIFVEKKP